MTDRPETNGNARDIDWAAALGDGARDVLSDLSGQAGLDDARHAFDALSEALGEDGPTSDVDPGLPADFTVLGVLGRGGSGVVYRARQESLDREVAVKVLHPGGSPRDTERLLAEAKRLAAVTHKGIVAVHEIGRARTGVYVSLELQPGGSLQALLAAEPLNPTRAARVTRQAAEALAYTHSRGVVHLDLKPANVLLDADGNARVADFGLARELAGMEFSATTGGLVGTPAFMAPEQAAGRNDQLGEKTDVYGLGAVLYACLAGSAPFARRSLADLLHAVRFEDPAPLDRVAPSAPRDLVAIARKAMAKEPEERYATARALAQDIARFEAGESVEARLPNIFQRSWIRIRRHRRELLTVIVACAIAILSVLPFRTGGGDAGEVWIEAVEELTSSGEARAALHLLDCTPESVVLNSEQELRLARARSDARSHLAGVVPSKAADSTVAPPVPEEAHNEKRSKREERFGLQAGDWVWLRENSASAWMEDPSLFWDATAIGLERVWQKLLEGLGASWGTMLEDERQRATEIAASAPHWNWIDGFQRWTDGTPGGASELVEAIAAASPADTGDQRYGILIDVFVIDGQGTVEKVGSGNRAARIGETPRIEGRGRSAVEVPRDHMGMNFLRLTEPTSRLLQPGDVSYEVDGKLEKMAGGVHWSVSDCETYLGMGHYDGSWFLDLASDGVLAGKAGLIDVRRYLWGKGEAATLFMLAEVVELSPGESFQPERDLDDWLERLASNLSDDLALPFDTEEWANIGPTRQAAFIDAVATLATLGPAAAEDSLAAIEERFAFSPLDPTTVSASFFEARTFTGVTSAGADFDYWLNSANSEPLSGVNATLEALPKPVSARGRSSPGSPRAWLYALYVPCALAMLLIALRHSAGGAKRLPLVGWAIALAAMGLDKTTPVAFGLLGSKPWDPLALFAMAWGSFLLAPWASGWARAAGWAFIASLAHELAAQHGWLPGPRLFTAIGVVSLAQVAARLDPRMRFSWTGGVLIGIFLAGVLTDRLGLQWRVTQRGLFAMSIASTLVVLISVAVSASRRAREDTSSSTA